MIWQQWYDKPLNIQKPVDVDGRASGAIKELADRKADIWSDIMTLFPRGEITGLVTTFTTIFVFMYVGLIFGGVNCFAWRFSFPTVTELVLWRVSAVVCTASPFVLLGVLARLQSKPVLFIVIAVYVICRVILVVLTFTSLRAAPPGVFHATAWTSFIPHFG